MIFFSGDLRARAISSGVAPFCEASHGSCFCSDFFASSAAPWRAAEQRMPDE